MFVILNTPDLQALVLRVSLIESVQPAPTPGEVEEGQPVTNAIITMDGAGRTYAVADTVEQVIASMKAALSQGS